MKRTIILIGLLLPLLDASPPLQGQHYIRPTKRNVYYRKSRIPSKINIPYSEHVPTESKTKTFSQYSGRDDSGWYLHIDASFEHPDNARKQILRRYSNDAGGSSTKGAVESIELQGSSLSRWLTKLNIFDGRFTFYEKRDRALFENSQAQTSQLTSFNVSANTEHNVSFGTTSASDVVNETRINDLSTVIVTSNNPNDVNSTNSSIGSNDDDAIIAGDTKVGYRPLRIRSFLSNEEGGGKHLTNYQRTVLLQDIVKPALLSWSAALRVNPVVGNLTVDPNQLSNGGLCGPGGDLPSIVVPDDHISIGVPNTDFIIYVHLAFVINQSSNTTSNEFPISKNITNVEYNFTSESSTDSYVNSTTNTSKLNTNNLTTRRQCSGDYLAASSFCSTDQYDRPIAAIIHICIGKEFFDAANLRTNIMVISHELGHALGFNAVSLAHFRRPNGTPYTDRDPITGEIPITEINCTGPVSSNRTGRVALPSNEILKFRTVRGGVRVAEIVTPFVQQVVRNHFDCQQLPGAELESGEFLPLSTYPGEVSCIGDHWERRLFKTDLMNPLIDDNVEFTTRFSTITLAYFADSGWYQVDLSRASLSAGWGRAAGCEFVEQTCVNAMDGQVPSSFNSFFCNEIPVGTSEFGYTDIHGCTTDLTRKASCSIGHYEGELPPAYQYFNFKYGSNVGGADPFMDYCPVYTGFVNGLCSDSSNEAVIKVNYIERFGLKNSRCLSGKMAGIASSFVETGPNDTSSRSTTHESTALCLPIACVVEDRTLRVQVNGDWKVCSYKDQVLFTSDLSESSAADTIASVICPDPIRVCPTFYCHRDCLGSSRLCDYNLGRCVCGGASSGNISSADVFDRNGKSFANLNETDPVTCKTPNSSESIDQRHVESFYVPENNDDTSGLPTSDSPLSDYYYKTERNLKLESSTNFWYPKWKAVVSGFGTCICLVLISFVSYYTYSRHISKFAKNGAANDDDGGGDDDVSTNDVTLNPNKDKLMASVVVNLRMNDTNLQRLRHDDPLLTRDSETDMSMTDTDGVSEIIGSLDFSMELPSTALDYGGTIVDLASYDNAVSENMQNDGGLHDDFMNVYVDPLAPPSAQALQQPIVRRRRHFFSRIQ